jgi:AraC family transcriptional regulator
MRRSGNGLEVGSPTDRALWFVESHFAQALGLDEIAEAGGLSRSEMSRAFRRETGIALSAYLRGRRLTEAAKALAAGAASVTEVALACGYGSHEAFGRAFRAEFRMTPAELRRRASLDGLALTAPVRGASNRGAPILSYRFLHGAPLRIAGVKEHLPPHGYPGIPAIWQRFHAEIGVLGIGERVEAFGVVSIARPAGEGFDYLAGVEVKETVDIPRNLATVRIPAQRYAVFPHRGHVAELKATALGVIAEWLPKSRLAASGPPDFIERYAADFDPWTGRGGIEIWVPITAG